MYPDDPFARAASIRRRRSRRFSPAAALRALLLIAAACLPNVAALARAAEPRSVVDYYLAMPDKFANGAKRAAREKIAAGPEGKGRLVARDLSNNYLAVAREGTDPGLILAIFTRPDGARFAAVTRYGEDARGVTFLLYRDGVWTDVTSSIVPSFNRKYRYRLPRYGTTVEVSDSVGKPIYNLRWSNGQFVRRGIGL